VEDSIKDKIDISLLEKQHSAQIAKLAVCLTQEIIERTGVHQFDVNDALATSLCEQYIANGQYHVLAAHYEDRIIGFGSLCESHSLYAEGTFGILQEFYVLPEYRSHNVGQLLIDKIATYAKQKNWKRLELCTPPVPEFDRTVAFYKDNGFEITGGYKMKRIISS